MSTSRRPNLLLIGSALLALVGCDHMEDCGGSGGTMCSHSTPDTAASDTTASDTTTSDTAAAATDATAADMTATPEGIAVQSSKGDYNAWFAVPAASKVGQADSVQVTVQAASGSPMPGLALAPKYIHITMGHGGSKLPVATEVGAGIYTVGNLVASMPGEWRLTVTLPGGDAAMQTWQVAK